MRSNRNLQHSEGVTEQISQNRFHKTKTLSIYSKLDNETNRTSELAMVVGICLLIIGTLFSNVLLNNGLEGITLSFFVVGFSLIFYGVAEDNK